MAAKSPRLVALHCCVIVLGSQSETKKHLLRQPLTERMCGRTEGEEESELGVQVSSGEGAGVSGGFQGDGGGYRHRTPG